MTRPPRWCGSRDQVPEPPGDRAAACSWSPCSCSSPGSRCSSAPSSTPCRATSAPCSPSTPASAGRSWSTGRPIAESVETDDELKYLRTYPIGPMFASATGFYSIVYGATGLEKAENEVLSGEDPRLFVDRMQQLFAGREIQGGSVTTTLDGAAQKAAWDGLTGKVGSVAGHRAEHRADPGPGAEPVVRPQRAELAQLQGGQRLLPVPRGRPGQAAAQPADRQDQPARARRSRW